MIEQRENEPRINYLARVLYHLMNNTPAGCEVIDYDDVECDGMCLADDILSALDMDADDC